MRRPLSSSLLALVLVSAVALPSTVLAGERSVKEPSTTTIRIRLKGPTLRVRCRGGDCVVSVVGTATGMDVSVTRTRDGVPFTFARSLPPSKNVAIETGIGTDQVTVADLAIPGFLRIGTGTGDDVLDVSNVATARKGSINVGEGDDTVHLDGASFGGKLRFFAQDGDDDVTISDGTFSGKVGLDGGPGTDRLVTEADAFAEPPVTKSFER